MPSANSYYIRLSGLCEQRGQCVGLVAERVAMKPLRLTSLIVYPIRERGNVLVGEPIISDNFNDGVST